MDFFSFNFFQSVLLFSLPGYQIFSLSLSLSLSLSIYIYIYVCVCVGVCVCVSSLMHLIRVPLSDTQATYPYEH